MNIESGVTESLVVGAISGFNRVCARANKKGAECCLRVQVYVIYTSHPEQCYLCRAPVPEGGEESSFEIDGP